MRNQILTVLIAVAAMGSALAEPPPSMEDLNRTKLHTTECTFRMTLGIIDGKEVPDEVRQQTVLVTDRNKFTVSDHGTAGTSAEGIFTIDPTKVAEDSRLCARHRSG